MKQGLILAQNPYLSVIIPTLNEAGSMAELIDRIDYTLVNEGVSYEIIVVDDHSTDSTCKIVEDITGEYPVRTYLKKGKQGKAESIKEGLDYANGEILSFIDGDLQYPPEKLPDMLLCIKEGYDVVIGERQEREVSFLRRVPSTIFRFIFLRLLHGFPFDVQSGLKVFKRDILKDVELNSTGWAFDLEFLLRAREKGAKITSIPIIFGKRKEGESKISLLAASYEIGKNAVLEKLRVNAPLPIAPEDSGSAIGAGFYHKGKHFVTHTMLPRATSALETITRPQKAVIIGVLILLTISAALSPFTTVLVFLAILSSVYFIDVVFSFYLVYKSLRHNPAITFTDSELSNVNPRELPVYTILYPLYKESAVLPTFLKAIDNLDYPKEKLDVLLLFEANDHETLDAAKNIKLPKYVRKLIVPDSLPKTKPKACNYGLAFAKGKYIVVYDAEDIPEVSQLKKAYLGFKVVQDNVVCLQAKLNYYNPRQNILTRLFTAEYSLWFDVMLPGLQTLNTYIPLGGTSNHFKTRVLKELNGWDPFNVTEDCDLGVRLFSKKYRTAMIDSITLEEANSRVGNWIRQRSRWIKGYMQTYLVYMRHPISFFRANGIHALLFQMIIGSKIIFGLINPILWGTTILYFTARSVVGPTLEELYPPLIFILAVFSGIFGNFLFLYYYMIGCVKRGHWSITKYVYLMPFYWFITSIAAYLAFYQLIVKPYYWEKTTHGLYIKRKKVTFAYGHLKRITENIGRTASYINPIRIPRYAFSLAHATIRRSLSAEPTREFPIPVINPPQFKKKSLKNQIHDRLSFLERYLPKSLSTTTVMKSGVLVASIMTANVLNLLFNMYLGRALSFEAFGLITFINALWLVLVIFYNPIVNTLDHVIATAVAKGGSDSASNFLFRILKKVIRTAFLLSLLWILAIPFVSDFFIISNIWALISFTPLIIFGIIDAVGRGYIKGSLQFHLLAMLMVLEASVKLISGIALVTLGLSEIVYLAIPAGVVVSAITAIWILRSEKGVPIKTESMPFPSKFYSASLIAGASALLFLSIDILLVKHYLEPTLAGEYALLSLVGKMMFFLAAFPTGFMITFVSREAGLKSETARIFKLLFSITAVFALLGFVILSLFGDFLIPLLFGAKAFAITEYISLYVAAIALYTLTNSIVTYHLAKKEYVFSAISLALSGVLTFGIILYHSTIGEVVAVIATTSAFGFFVVTFMHLLGKSLESTISIGIGALTFPFNPAVQAIRERKNILIFNWRDTKHVYAGGAELYVHEMAKRWVKVGYDVTLFCGNDRKNKRYETVDGVNIVRRGGFYLVYFWAPIYYLFILRKKFDIVIDCENGIPFFTPLFRRGKTYCLLHHVHQEVFTKSLQPILAFVARFIEKRLMPIIYVNTPFITVSESSKKEMIKLGIGKKGITVIHPGVDLSTLSPGVKSAQPLVAYIGRLKEYKSIDVLIDSFKYVLEKIPNAKLFIAGSGEEEINLKNHASTLNLTDSIEFLGKITDKAKAILLQNAWVTVNPSLIEGWGITTIEANACGTTVVASNVGGLKDSIKNPHTGYLVPYGDSKELSEKIILVLTNKELREKMEKDAIKWAAYFNWDTTSRQFLQTIDPIKKYV